MSPSKDDLHGPSLEKADMLRESISERLFRSFLFCQKEAMSRFVDENYLCPMKAAKNRGKMPKYTQRDRRATLI